jgi:hypothetical protein
MTDPALPLAFPHIVNLMTDPKEREPYNPVYLHTWTMAHFHFGNDAQVMTATPRPEMNMTFINTSTTRSCFWKLDATIQTGCDASAR